MKLIFTYVMLVFAVITSVHSEEKSQDFGAVLKALNSDNPAERAKAVEAIKNDKLVDEFLAPLAKAMQSNDEIVRVYAERTFVHLIYSMNLQIKARTAQDRGFPSRADDLMKLKQKDWAPKDGPAATGDDSKQAANEQMAVMTCKLYAQAQDEYRRTDWDKDGKLEYAQTLKELTREGMPAQLLKSLADAEGLKGTPKAGYLFKVLKKQGKDGPGGEREFVREGHMTVGYALLAWPAQYGVTGKNSFQISSAGTVYRQDFGKDTATLAEKNDVFFSDSRWQVAE